jgi:acyl-coenzyme A thioesterase PaaI-like protein
MSAGPLESTVSVQERYAPANRCFGCGPANAEGLRLRSFPASGRVEETPAEKAAVERAAGEEARAKEGPAEGAAHPDELVAAFRPAPHHLAFDGIVNGGIIGALLDCHSNWTAALALMRASGRDEPPCTVTADFHVKLKRPTPIDGLLTLRAHPVRLDADRAVVEATVEAGGRITATCRGTFVAVKPGHPAYHRW